MPEPQKPQDEETWWDHSQNNESLPDKTHKQTKLALWKNKFSKFFSNFHGFWTPLLAVIIIMAMGFFISGIPDRDIVSYSMLMVVAIFILIHSWKEVAFSTDNEPHGTTHWLLKPFLVFFKLLVATIPQTITLVQLAIILTIFTKYKDIVYQKQIPDVFGTFNWGLFVIMLGQIGMINWYLNKNVAMDQTFFQKSFLPIFVIIATISSGLMAELYVIIRHFVTDG